jgi:hypothetical protein
MNSIKDIIPQVIAPLSSGNQTPAQVGTWWQRHYGSNKKTSVVSLKEGTLTVHVDCAHRRVKMELERDDYLKHVQSCFPSVLKIYFKVGKII